MKMKKLFGWALIMVALEVAVFSVAYMLSHSYETATAFAVFTVIAATVVFAANAIAIIKEENLPLWRVLLVLAGGVGGIIGWMLLFQHSLLLSAAALAAGIVIMAAASFAGVTNARLRRPRKPSSLALR